MRFSDEAKCIAVCSFYLSSNFIPFFLPALAYKAYSGSKACLAFWGVVLCDYLVPLKMPGVWTSWCLATNDTKGKESYFSSELKVEGEFRKDQNYLVCYHPHSLFGIGYNILTTYLYNTLGIQTLFTGADVVLYLPLLRRFLSWWGITAVNAKAMKKNLTLQYPHNVLVLLPGGVAEMFYGIGKHEQIILNKRKGFCKLALQTGASLVPLYVFGANQTYTRYFGPQSFFAKLSSRLQVSLVCWTDRFGIPFGLIPHKIKMVVAVGKPIPVQTVESPTEEEVLAVHQQYVSASRDLFERHKFSVGGEWSDKQLLLEDEKLKKSD